VEDIPDFDVPYLAFEVLPIVGGPDAEVVSLGHCQTGGGCVRPNLRAIHMETTGCAIKRSHHVMPRPIGQVHSSSRLCEVVGPPVVDKAAPTLSAERVDPISCPKIPP